jgi:hypothetical protein
MVDVEVTDPDPYVPPIERHALIYTNGTVAVTFYECCYVMWHLFDGRWVGGFLGGRTHRLSKAAMEAAKMVHERRLIDDRREEHG